MGSKSKSSRDYKGSKAQGSSSSSQPPVSFLFIVNELPTNNDPEIEGSIPLRHQHGRWLPPDNHLGFLTQKPGYVYRWNNGDVSLAQGYYWRDDRVGNPVIANGTIYKYEGGDIWPQYYRGATVFYGGSFFQFFTAQGDVGTRDICTSSPEAGWHYLKFHHENRISRVDHDAPEEHLIVRSAGWIPDLLPEAYRSQSTRAVNQGGLGGLLSIVVALVAFSCIDKNELHYALINDRAWRGHRWVPHGRESGRTKGRGVVATIYLDPENTEGSTRDSINNIEQGNTPIFRT
ncbi:uncharacterized protein BP5553_00938 [Venustampulla echinocandica]|uniref:Uncharacterized protein n=1 Tax=Venustampulla echinocandica TaxID=2656787 RepID=A0A370TZK4_9HELO|nr:uncharacterized protein BP5553_00938 [Venustampulla echinocandica]RDL40959.1 hypothetical protein BP5553_00938 [Venustampulla echinocandica]